jgi:high affinity Mn2+ porin
MMRRTVIAVLLAAVTLAWLAAPARAQVPELSTSQVPEPTLEPGTILTMFRHSDTTKYWVSGQMNFISQFHPSFYALYSGQHSLKPEFEHSFSRVLTLYAGYQFNQSIEVLADLEEAGGHGVSGTYGVAGFPNLDSARDPYLGAQPYLARLMYHQVVALSPEKKEANRGPLSLFTLLPTRRLEFRVGKFSIVDFFDINGVGGDSHLQFMNWAIDQNAGYDFAADPRGYTWGVVMEYQSPHWGLRFGEGLMSDGGAGLEWNLRKANTSNFEFEVHRGFLKKKDGIIRVLAYINNGNMGVYQYANEQYLAGKVSPPEITAHPEWVTTKYGFGVNFEQALSVNILTYGRFGWDNGKTESYSFTEVDQVFAGGVGFIGKLWKRNNDRAGAAFFVNGITSEHARYLSFGGLGLVLGDGGLSYARERGIESYYTGHVWRGLYVSGDIQYIVNPGYNQVRGPVVVPSFRLHVEL